MWISKDNCKLVDEVASISYVDQTRCYRWNKYRREGELRMFTGWQWIARDGSGETQQGLKTISACYRDAYLRLVLQQSLPSLNRRVKLRRVV